MLELSGLPADNVALLQMLFQLRYPRRRYLSLSNRQVAQLKLAESRNSLIRNGKTACAVSVRSEQRMVPLHP